MNRLNQLVFFFILLFVAIPLISSAKVFKGKMIKDHNGGIEVVDAGLDIDLANFKGNFLMTDDKGSKKCPIKNGRLSKGILELNANCTCSTTKLKKNLNFTGRIESKKRIYGVLKIKNKKGKLSFKGYMICDAQKSVK